MNPNWKNHLLSAGAVIENDCVLHFGNPDQELAATQSSTVLCDLSHLGLIGISGEDSQTFLQGQTTNDVRLPADRAQHNSLCTPKGRMLASFLLWRNADGYLLQLPAVLQAAIQKRLTMYVLRSKVKLRDASAETVRLGLSGSGAEALLQQIAAVPQDPLDVANTPSASVIRLGPARFELIVPAEQGAALWNTLRQGAVPAGSGCWEWLNIRSGIPEILPPTQEQFTPQMASFEALGGVSFTKGCYTGQEVVARTQYLGKVKRRLYLAHVDTDSAPQPGNEVHGVEQSTGMVVNARPAPGGGFDLLAVIPSHALEGGSVHLKTVDGPVLTFQPLPYAAE